MSVSRLLGTTAAGVLTGATMFGITALIARDFDGKNVLMNFGASVADFWKNFDKPEEDLKTALKGVEDITFFARKRIEGTKYEVSTGTTFASSADVVAGTIKSQWCYISAGGGDVSTRIDLGNAQGGATPTYTSLENAPKGVLSDMGFSAAALRATAKTHCQFGAFDPRERSDNK